MIRRLLRRCDYRGCWSSRKVTGSLRRGDVTIRESFCDPHAELVFHAALPKAGKVDVWNENGDHAQLVDRDTAIRMQAIADGTGVREARRKLDRKKDRPKLDIVQHWHGSE